MLEKFDKTNFNSERFLKDLELVAKAINAPYSETATRKVLSVFEHEFYNHVVQYKTTSKPNSDLYYRFFYNGEKDLTRLALENSLIPQNFGDQPIVQLHYEALKKLDGATRTGFDFETNTGLAKEWTFTGGPVEVTDIERLSNMPEEFRSYSTFFKKYGLKYVGFLSSDYQNNTMNVYFRWDPENRTEAWLQTIVQETGGAPLSDELCADILKSQAYLSGLATTFSWDKPQEMLRWCVYSLETPYGDSRTNVHLPKLPERLKVFNQVAPSLNEVPSYHMGWSFGKAGPYLKLEKNYSRDATYFFTTYMGANMAHPELTSV